MSFNKDSEILWLKTEIIPKLLKQQKLIDSFNESQDFEKFNILNIDLKLVGSEEAFMLTTCYRAAIQLEFKGVTNKVNFFVKVS